MIIIYLLNFTADKCLSLSFGLFLPLKGCDGESSPMFFLSLGAHLRAEDRDLLC